MRKESQRISKDREEFRDKSEPMVAEWSRRVPWKDAGASPAGRDSIRAFTIV